MIGHNYTGSQVDNLLIPSELLCGPDSESLCFNVTAEDDEHPNGYDTIFIILFKPGDQRYQLLEPASIFHLLIVDNDGKSRYNYTRGSVCC